MLGAGAFTENFRSALNGFNRTDVVQFIQRQTVEHEKSMRLLREENARLKQAAAEPKQDTKALQSEKEELAQELARCKEELAALTREKEALIEQLSATVQAEEPKNSHDQTAALQGQIESLTRENTELKAEASTLSDRNAELRKQVETYAEQIADLRREGEALAADKQALTQSLKECQETLAATEAALEEAKATKDEAPALLDRPMSAPAGLAVAPGSFDEMELAAYRRAEQTERMARERAIASSNRIQNVFRQADEKMVLTAADMNLLLENMKSNYTQMQILMENARNILSESAESLKVSAELSSIV